MRKSTRIASLIVFLAVVVLGAYVAVQVPKPNMHEQDIYYSYVEGGRLVAGENPYARVLESDMRHNDKYATYFPVFYELSYASQLLGLNTFESWMLFWSVIFTIFQMGTAVLLYLSLVRRGVAWAGVFAAAFWLLSRWTLGMVSTLNMDFVPIFFLIASLELFPRKQNLSLLLFSLSLGFKQIAIFLVPLYIIWVYQSAPRKEWMQRVAKGAALIASVPLLSALPFLVWNAKAFVVSMLFSATRASNSLGGVTLDAAMGWEGLRARLPMLALMGLVYLLAFTGDWKKYLPSTLIMAVFINFNSVLYPQYFVWLLPLMLLLLSDFQDFAKPAQPA
ncbi:MAG: hypothetical protein KIS88_07380 [Anaerolineales bacterium]|nr:hypothetical protein [Anaerolineales bacterium]